MAEPASDATTHKRCPGCGTAFTMDQILESAEIEPIGMQLEDNDHAWNFYYFNHRCPSCGSTFVIPVLDFLPWITEPVPQATLTGTESCERHCMRLDDLGDCQARCRYAPFRRLLLRMRSRKASGPADDAVARPPGRR